MKHTKQKPDCVTTDPSTPNKGTATSDAYQEGNSVLACRCVTSQVCYRQATFARQTFVQRIGEIINVFNKQTNKQRTLDRRKAQRLRTSWRTTYSKSRKKQIRFKHRPLPFTATFWRTTIASRILYESPYMDIEGVSADNFAIDRLHTWDLGPLQRYIALVFWIMIEFKVWECDIAYLDAACAIRLCLLRLRGDMWTYYYSKRYTDPSWKKKGSEVTTLGIYIYIYARGVCARVFAYKQTHTHKHQDQALKEYALWGKG